MHTFLSIKCAGNLVLRNKYLISLISLGLLWYRVRVCKFLCSPCDRPRVIDSLRGKEVVDIAAGGAHSACITANGELYTWGKGRYGRLGHGDSEDQPRPKLVCFLFNYQILYINWIFKTNANSGIPNSLKSTSIYSFFMHIINIIFELFIHVKNEFENLKGNTISWVKLCSGGGLEVLPCDWHGMWKWRRPDSVYHRRWQCLVLGRWRLWQTW